MGNRAEILSETDQLQLDTLTGLYNEAAFYKHTHELLMKDKETQYVFVRGDIDSFVVINELYGFKFGDCVLVNIASAVKSLVEGKGTCGRIGSDHFACCVRETAFKLNEVRDHLNKFLKDIDMLYKITWHIGIYRVDDHSMSVRQMSDRANSALKSIKQNQMIGFAFYDRRRAERTKREQIIIKDMREALENREFKVYFQPIYSINQGVPVSAEALVRWDRPGEGMVTPAEFIPVFEKCGFITYLDFFVWEETCREIRRRLDSGLNAVPISVNMSRLDTYSPTIVEDILELTDKYDINHLLLRFEITETMYMENPQRLVKVLNRLQKEGFTILLDDYGSGFSTAASLIDIPFDIMKIDQEFVQNMSNSEKCAFVLDSIFVLADKLHVPVVAEGVENDYQCRSLKQLGCEYMQGYYYSQPVPAEQFCHLLDIGKARSI